MEKLILLLFSILVSFLLIDAIQFELAIEKPQLSKVKFNHILNGIKNGKLSKLRKNVGGKFLDTEFPGDYFLANVSLGTPPQTFSLEVDTSFPALCVLGKNFTNATDKNHLYDPSVSTTSAYDSEIFINNYQSGSMVGVTYKDVFALDKYSSNNQTFGVIDKINDAFGPYPTDGVLGLDWSTNVSKTIPYFDPPIEHIGSEFDQKLYTIYISPYKDEHIKSGSITFGALNTQNCGEFSYFPLLETKPFIIRTFAIEGFSVQKYTRLYTDIHATYNTEFPVTLTPPDEFREILRSTEASFDFSENLYTVPCNEISRKPDLIWQIGGKQFPVASSAYIVDIKLLDNKCALAIDMFPAEIYTKAVILGDSFAQTYCASFNFGDNTLGLAKVK